MNKELWLLLLLMMHFAVLSYFDEFLVARHFLFKYKMRISKVIGFGRADIFYHARTGAIEFYTIISYYEQNKEYTAKITRGMGDVIGKEILVAVEENDKLAVRYQKCNWYGQNYSEEPIKGVRGLKLSIFMYVFSHVSMIFWFFEQPQNIWKLYQIYILIAIMHYLFLPQLVKIRNYIWKKSTGGIKINDNELRRGMIAFLSILIIVPCNIFLYITIMIMRNVKLAIITITGTLYFIFLIVLCVRKMKKEDNSIYDNSKIIWAEVILVDNANELKMLICQSNNGEKIIQYQKIQYINFLEKIGDFVKVRVESEDASKYEILNKIIN